MSGERVGAEGQPQTTNQKGSKLGPGCIPGLIGAVATSVVRLAEDLFPPPPPEGSSNLDQI